MTLECLRAARHKRPGHVLVRDRRDSLLTLIGLSITVRRQQPGGAGSMSRDNDLDMMAAYVEKRRVHDMPARDLPDLRVGDGDEFFRLDQVIGYPCTQRQFDVPLDPVGSGQDGHFGLVLASHGHSPWSVCSYGHATGFEPECLRKYARLATPAIAGPHSSTICVSSSYSSISMLRQISFLILLALSPPPAQAYEP